MAANFSCTIAGTLTGLPAGSDTISFAYANASSPGLVDVVTTAATTAFALTIPTNTLFLLIVPPTSNVATIRVSGTGGGATGVTIHPTNPTMIALPASAAEVTLYTSAIVTSIQVYYL